MNWIGTPVTDAAGRRYGRLYELFIGRTTGQPEFGIISLDEEANERVVVPLAGAYQQDDGTLLLGVDPERVIGAPRVKRDVDKIPAEAGELILDYFGLSSSTASPPSFHEQTERGLVDADSDEAPTEVIRSEEQLSVGTRAVATERVRVRKRVVTEDVTITVSLRREELVLEREAIEDGDTPAPAEFPLAEEGSEVDFVLHAEEPVVAKRVVPVERVRLHREVSAEEQQITESVRKELVDVDELSLTPEEDPPQWPKTPSA
jgi:uncharacterized protein (TIGR02271 family)